MLAKEGQRCVDIARIMDLEQTELLFEAWPPHLTEQLARKKENKRL